MCSKLTLCSRRRPNEPVWKGDKEQNFENFLSCGVRIGDKEHSTFISTELLYLAKVSTVYMDPKVT